MGVTGIAFDPAGALYVERGPAIRRLQVAEPRQELSALPGMRVALSQDGKLLAIGRFGDKSDKSVVEVQNSEGKLVHTIAAHAQHLLAFSRDGKVLVTGDVRLIRRWDTASGKELSNWDLSEECAGSRLALSPDGKTIAATSQFQKVVRLYESATGKQLAPDSGHTVRTAGPWPWRAWANSSYGTSKTASGCIRSLSRSRSFGCTSSPSVRTASW